MSSSASSEPFAVKFLPFSSTVDSPFWVQYCHLKLETIRLKEDPIDIRASYGDYTNRIVADGDNNSTPSSATSNRLQCQESSLKSEQFVVPNNRVACQGTLVGYNTLEAFQKVDKNAFLKQQFCEQFFGAQDDMDCLTSFVLVTFADLKQHKVLYWFAFPALMTKTPITASLVSDPASILDYDTVAKELQMLCTRKEKLCPFFVIQKSDSTMRLLSDVDTQKEDNIESQYVFAFVDPTTTATSTDGTPPIMGWPMRNLVAHLVLRLGLGGKTVQILSVRPGPSGGIFKTRIDPKQEGSPAASPADVQALKENSIMMQVALPTAADYDFNKDDAAPNSDPLYKVVGWELNARHKPGPRWVNLRPLLDQNHLSIQAADLNLKLMKWRMIPSLNVEMLQSTKVLLLGAGTLGCSVSRTLLGWGVRQFKFVDYGTVSYSNPVRQNLFTLDDCHYNYGQGRPKAQAAADALKAIAADVTSEGIFLSIPMPGHAAETTSAKGKSEGATSSSAPSLDKTVKQLDALVQEADVVFLLTDTRESRWLPTLMAAVHDKPLINAALGLDSWLVMRHGGDETSDENGAGKRLGCYFCNDVVAPENSTKNRTLDQQCTVTRPGLAPIASSMAVELLVSLLHHSKKQRAPAPAPTSHQKTYSPAGNAADSESSSALGVIPHQIRGSLVSYTMMAPTVPAFKCCTGCALPVIQAYKEDKFTLVSNVCASMDGSYLENLSGLTAFRAEAAEKMAEMDEDWDEDE